MNKSVKAYQNGQAIWLDNINRNLLLNGGLARKVEGKQIWGLTSNPSIFQKAISGSDTYHTAIQAMSWLGYSTEEIYEEITVRDVQDAADLLQPIFEETSGRDGYVSLEVDPDLANKAEETISEAKRLWHKVNRKNLFIKIPATTAGISAIREVISAGINVNVTLIFSIDRYRQVIDAYLEGLEIRIAAGSDISAIHSVASFFISRIDGIVDRKLQELFSGKEKPGGKPDDLMGKIGIANALSAYQVFKKSISKDRFLHLSEKGANFQRPLWASTSAKNPEYPDTLYVDSLMLPQTVNTVPSKTLDAFLDHGAPEPISFSKEFENAEKQLEQLEVLDISLDEITEKLEAEGVKAFSAAQKTLFQEIDALQAKYLKEIQPIQGNILKILKELEDNNIFSRLCQHDATLWSMNNKEIAEIRHRLAWMNAPTESLKIITAAESLLSKIISEGYTHAVVLGMGGSSLAPEVFAHMAGIKTGDNSDSLEVLVLDSSAPQQILETQDKIPLDKTIFIVSSKSGGTIETLSLYTYFWKELLEKGFSNPGKHFIAITDPGSKLEKIGKENEFRAVISANPDVGGRFSALIEFGLIPAVFSGLDGKELLSQAKQVKVNCKEISQVIWNEGIALGIALGAGYETSRDKLTLIADSKLIPIGTWIEQLVAESSGKNGKGLLPVQDEPLLLPPDYYNDRLFVYLSHDDERKNQVEALSAAGHPVIKIKLRNGSDLGKFFLVWESAISVACVIMGINAFDQPDVQLSKDISKEMVRAYKNEGKLDFGELNFENDFVRVYTTKEVIQQENLKGLIEDFIGDAGEGNYIAINAFLASNEVSRKKLQNVRELLLRKYKVATTLGFGPRFLHSTGQYHKGGTNSGLFIVISQEQEDDLMIPDEEIRFGTLLNAQAVGDRNALAQQNRRVLHMHFKKSAFADFQPKKYF